MVVNAFKRFKVGASIIISKIAFDQIAKGLKWPFSYKRQKIRKNEWKIKRSIISHKNVCTIIFQLLSFLMVKKVSFLNTSACLAVHDLSLKAFFSGKIWQLLWNLAHHLFSWLPRSLEGYFDAWPSIDLVHLDDAIKDYPKRCRTQSNLN